jgi:hypothetical protein
MTRKEQPEPGTLKSLFAPYISIAMAYVKMYVVIGLLFTGFVAMAFPKFVAVVATILVVIGLAALFGVLYLRRKFEHVLIARRADKQDRLYIRGNERGTYGKHRPERLDGDSPPESGRR